MSHRSSAAALRSTSTGRARQAALRAVAEAGHADPATPDWLRDRAADDHDEEVRETAVSAVARRWYDDEAMLPWLRIRATVDPSETVRQLALETVARGWRDEATVTWLRARVTDERSDTVRRAALEAVAYGWFDDPNTREWLNDLAERERSFGGLRRDQKLHDRRVDEAEEVVAVAYQQAARTLPAPG